MRYSIEKSFKKDFEKLKDKKLSAAILKTIENVEQAQNDSEINNLKN